MSTKGKRYGYKKDKVDPRDLHHTFAIKAHHQAIKLVDLRSHCPPVYNQGDLGSCTANAIAALYEFDEMKEKEMKIFTPSRLFIYYNERVMEGTVNEDDGAEIRDGMKSINALGVCPEVNWPYDVAAFAKKPSAKLYALAKKHKCVQYKRLTQNIEQLKQCLIEGFPFVFGIMVYSEFEGDEVAKSGIVPMPVAGTQPLGGHAVMCVGYDETKSVFIVRNSWGVEWGDHGYFYLPYAYVLSPELSSDFWTATRVDDAPIITAPMPMVMSPDAAVVVATNAVNNAIGTAASVAAQNVVAPIIDAAKVIEGQVVDDAKKDIEDVKKIVTDIGEDIKKDALEVEAEIEQITAQIKFCCIPCCKIVSK